LPPCAYRLRRYLGRSDDDVFADSMHSDTSSKFFACPACILYSIYSVKYFPLYFYFPFFLLLSLFRYYRVPLLQQQQQQQGCREFDLCGAPVGHATFYTCMVLNIIYYGVHNIIILLPTRHNVRLLRATVSARLSPYPLAAAAAIHRVNSHCRVAVVIAVHEYSKRTHTHKYRKIT